MPLKYKPDFDRVKDVMTHFWEGAIIDRPPILAQLVKPRAQAVDVRADRYLNAVNGNHDRQFALIDEWLENTEFLGEFIPAFSPDHGPDQIGACLGSELVFNPDSQRNTNWARPVIEEWSEFLPVKLEKENKTWQSILTFNRRLAKHSAGKYLVSCIDFGLPWLR